MKRSKCKDCSVAQMLGISGGEFCPLLEETRRAGSPVFADNDPVANQCWFVTEGSIGSIAGQAVALTDLTFCRAPHSWIAQHSRKAFAMKKQITCPEKGCFAVVSCDINPENNQILGATACSLLQGEVDCDQECIKRLNQKRAEQDSTSQP